MLSFQSTVDEIGKIDPELVIIPIGSIEQHGPHLPTGTDWYIADAIGKGVAKKTNGYLLPALPISTCREHMGKKGSVWMDPDIFYHMLHSMLLGLYEQGFRKALMLQCHGGIFMMPPIIRQINATCNPGFMAVNIDTSVAPTGELAPEQPELHAGDIETSLMLHIAPETVHMELAQSCFPDVPRSYLGYGSIFRASPIGVWGDPTIANAEKGKKLLDYYVDWAICEADKAFEYMSSKEKFGYSNF